MEPTTGSGSDPSVRPVPFLVPPPPETNTASSFTSLLELPPNQARVLLNSPDYPQPTLPTRLDETVKTEPADPDPSNQQPPSLKRKERDKKVRSANAKKGKGKSSQNEEGEEKLPYVHVRAPRGQATDSHSLAERARREKINARMKLLQELVPGCNKISGTAMILDEIINHVHHLQRQVEFLSMRLAAVNTRIDFNVDAILAAESGSLGDSNFPTMVMPPLWSDVQINMNRQQYQQQWHFDAVNQPVWGIEEDNNSNFVTQEQSFLSPDSSANSALLRSGQLKMEL